MEPRKAIPIKNILYQQKRIIVKKKLIQHHKTELVTLVSANVDVSVN